MTRNQFKTFPLVYDSRGIKIGARYLLEHNVKDYIQDSIKELSKKVIAKKILEVGFGAGYTARAIQKYFKPDLHIIVEARPEIAQWARDLAVNIPSIRIFEGFIQDFQTTIEFDLIYDDREELVNALPIEWCLIRHKYWATFCHPPAGIEDMNSGFIFTSGVRQYFQHIHQPDEYYFI